MGAFDRLRGTADARHQLQAARNHRRTVGKSGDPERIAAADRLVAEAEQELRASKGGA